MSHYDCSLDNTLKYLNQGYSGTPLPDANYWDVFMSVRRL